MMKFGYFKVFTQDTNLPPGYIVVALDRPVKGDLLPHEATFSFQKPSKNKFRKDIHREACIARKKLNSTVVRFEHQGNLTDAFKKALNILYTQGTTNRFGKPFVIPEWTLEPVKNNDVEFGLRQSQKIPHIDMDNAYLIQNKKKVKPGIYIEPISIISSVA